MIEEFNFSLTLGFLIWSALCLTMIVFGRFRENHWKRAAKAMECHAARLQREIDFNSDTNPLWESIPKGVITHAKKQQ